LGSLGPSSKITSTVGGVVADDDLFPFFGGGDSFTVLVDDPIGAVDSGSGAEPREPTAGVGPDGDDIWVIEGTLLAVAASVSAAELGGGLAVAAGMVITAGTKDTVELCTEDITER